MPTWGARAVPVRAGPVQASCKGCTPPPPGAHVAAAAAFDVTYNSGGLIDGLYAVEEQDVERVTHAVPPRTKPRAPRRLTKEQSEVPVYAIDDFGDAAKTTDGLTMDFASLKKTYQTYEDWLPANRRADRYAHGFKESDVQDMLAKLKQKSSRDSANKFAFN